MRTALWSLLLAVGYIKADNVKKKGEITECDVSVTNQEVMGMFRSQIRGDGQERRFRTQGFCLCTDEP